MAEMIPTREDAWALLNEFNSNDSLIKHALGVEAVMRHMARRAGESEETWGVVGLIHDLDYERYSEQHCSKTREILEGRNWPASLVRAVVSHGWGLCSDVEPHSLMERTLYAIDELVGFVTACALVRPSRTVQDLEVTSVRKKWKQKTFAAGANREVIQKGVDMLDMDLEGLMAEVITGMRSVATEVGL